MRLVASFLRPNDDVATALVDLAAGTIVRIAAAEVEREVRVVEPIAMGHKFAVRDLASGLRIRKYGECIGRLTRDVGAGAWVHLHNLATSARRDARDDEVWAERIETPRLVRVIDGSTSVGECPLWDADAGRLYWIDVRDTPAIHMLSGESDRTRTFSMREDVGSIVLAGRNRLLVALRSGFAHFDPATGSLAPICDPEPDRPHNRMNDGKCDPAGRFWCGSMNPESGIAEGSLYVLDAGHRCRRALGDLLTPNGLAWSLDGATMYLADTRRSMIYAFAFDVATGALGERRVFADRGEMPGGPDGAAVDAEGFLWSAHWDGGCLVRYAPDGRTDRVLRLPVTRPTSCAFGGPGYRELFVTTATRGLSSERLRAEPLAGSVLVLDVGVTGVPPVSFAGANTARNAA